MKEIVCVEKLHWLFDKRSHVVEIKGISALEKSVLIELSEPAKNFTIEDYSGVEDLLEKICAGIERADKSV